MLNQFFPFKESTGGISIKDVCIYKEIYECQTDPLSQEQKVLNKNQFTKNDLQVQQTCINMQLQVDL